MEHGDLNFPTIEDLVNFTSDIQSLMSTISSSIITEKLEKEEKSVTCECVHVLFSQ